MGSINFGCNGTTVADPMVSQIAGVASLGGILWQHCIFTEINFGTNAGNFASRFKKSMSDQTIRQLQKKSII